MRHTKLIIGALLLLLPCFANATIIQGDFREELDFTAPEDRILERTGQALPNAGFELDESDEIFNSGCCGGALLVDLDPVTGILGLTGTPGFSYQNIDIFISSLIFDSAQEVVGVSAITTGLAFTFDFLALSFTADSVTVGYSNNSSQFLLGGTDTFQIELARTTTVPEPGTVALIGLGLLGVAARRKKKV